MLAILVSSLVLAQTSAPTAPSALPAPVAQSAPAAAASAAQQASTSTDLHQFAVLDAPGPTVSPTFGGVLGWVGESLIVTGPERVREAGSNGQVATFNPVAGDFKPLMEMYAVPGGRPGQLFFQRVATSPDWILTNDDYFGKVGTGGVMVIGKDPTSLSGWALRARLRQPAGMEAPNFGTSIATDGVFAAVGVVDQVVRGHDARVTIEHPSVCLFSYGAKGWQPAGSLTRGKEVNAMWYGASLAIDSGTLAVGSPRAIQPSPKQPLQAGGESLVCVYRFVDGTWKLEAEIRPPADCRSPTFGGSIALKGDTLVVRAVDLDGGAARVMVYRRSGTAWTYDGSLEPADPIMPGVGWGNCLGVGDGFVVVGDQSAMYPVPGEVEPQRGLGAVCVFTRDSVGWNQTWRLVASVPTATGRYGGAFVIKGRTIAVGRMRSETAGVEPGGALLFQLPTQ
ncbi:MAG: hypothetical protein EXS00_00225 [Phycisphaerales bacterium]|nr:hypothetical protein [Phycisphaerales bacterium]